jgi:hypothetical protein
MREEMKVFLIIIVFFGLQIVSPIIIRNFRDWLRSKSEIPENIFKEIHEPLERSEFLSYVSGIVERLFFVTIVVFDVSGAAGGMITWIVVKMATNWHVIAKGVGSNDEEAFAYRRLAFCSLHSSLFSMLLVVVGGLAIRQIIALDF